MDDFSYSYAEQAEIYRRKADRSRLWTIRGVTAGFLGISGLVSLQIQGVWPILAVSLILTLALRFQPATRTVGRLAEIPAIAFAVIFILNGLGVTLIFVYKSLIALLLVSSTLLESEGIRRGYIKRSLFPQHIPLCSSVALVFIAVVAIGRLLYRGDIPLLPELPLGLLLLLGLAGSLLNASTEEIIYRGHLMSRLEENVGAKGAVLLQGLFFAIAHLWMKVPIGPWGLLMVFVFGIAMGWLVKKTRGLFAAVYVHTLVDLAFFAVLLSQR
jgi:membrane protease YdiL (CAAX protease family)